MDFSLLASWSKCSMDGGCRLINIGGLQENGHGERGSHQSRDSLRVGVLMDGTVGIACEQ